MFVKLFDFVNFRKRGSRERDRESDRARSHDRRHRKPEREQRHLERPGGGHKGQERPQVNKERRTSDPSARGRHSSSHRPNAASRISRSPPDQQPRKPQNQQAKQPLRDKRYSLEMEYSTDHFGPVLLP